MGHPKISKLTLTDLKQSHFKCLEPETNAYLDIVSLTDAAKWCPFCKNTEYIDKSVMYFLQANIDETQKVSIELTWGWRY